MRNRAKCNLCGEIIESLTLDDVVACSCEQIIISGGNVKLLRWAQDYSNFLRVDDEGNEKPVTFVDKVKENVEENGSKQEQDLLFEFKNLIEYYENMKLHHITNKDLAEFMRVLLLIMQS